MDDLGSSSRETGTARFSFVFSFQQGVTGIFAGSAFNPKENVQLKDGKSIGLASYASRMNIQLLRASDFSQKLRERGCALEATVQKIARTARDEDDAKQLLEEIWRAPSEAEKFVSEAAARNRDVYDFESRLLGEAM